MYMPWDTRSLPCLCNIHVARSKEQFYRSRKFARHLKALYLYTAAS